GALPLHAAGPRPVHGPPISAGQCASVRPARSFPDPACQLIARASGPSMHARPPSNPGACLGSLSALVLMHVPRTIGSRPTGVDPMPGITACQPLSLRAKHISRGEIVSPPGSLGQPNAAPTEPSRILRVM